MRSGMTYLEQNRGAVRLDRGRSAVARLGEVAEDAGRNAIALGEVGERRRGRGHVAPLGGHAVLDLRRVVLVLVLVGAALRCIVAHACILAVRRAPGALGDACDVGVRGGFAFGSGRVLRVLEEVELGGQLAKDGRLLCGFAVASLCALQRA
jgi:hypothetical protein